MTPPLKSAEAYIPPTGWSDHSLHDARSLVLHCKIAYKISRDPSLLEKARENLARWRSRYEPGQAPLAFEEWERILTGLEAGGRPADRGHGGRHTVKIVLAVYRDPDGGGTPAHLRGVQPGLLTALPVRKSGPPAHEYFY